MGELSVTEEDYVIAVDGGLSYCGSCMWSRI